MPSNHSEFNVKIQHKMCGIYMGMFVKMIRNGSFILPDDQHDLILC